MLQPGQEFAGKYRVGPLIAHGGVGSVYEAEQLNTESPVAIKVLHRHVLLSDEAVERLQLEAKIAGRLGGNFVVQIFDTGFDEATRLPYLVMERLRGETLKSYVDKNGPMPFEKVVELVSQVAQGLSHAHDYRTRTGERAPIVHRDLKPENLFLCDPVDRPTSVKILDFGLAKVVDGDAAVSQEVKGTPLFMAYEQAAGAAVSPQTDIWALGLTTFYMLAARPYWRSAAATTTDLTSLFAEVLSLPIEPPSQRIFEFGIDVHLPGSFDEWFLRCLRRRARERFASARDAADELSHSLLDTSRRFTATWRTTTLSTDTEDIQFASSNQPSPLRPARENSSPQEEESPLSPGLLAGFQTPAERTLVSQPPSLSPSASSTEISLPLHFGRWPPGVAPKNWWSRATIIAVGSLLLLAALQLWTSTLPTNIPPEQTEGIEPETTPAVASVLGTGTVPSPTLPPPAPAPSTASSVTESKSDAEPTASKASLARSQKSANSPPQPGPNEHAEPLPGADPPTSSLEAPAEPESFDPYSER